MCVQYHQRKMRKPNLAPQGPRQEGAMKNLFMLAAICIVVTVPGPIYSQSVDVSGSVDVSPSVDVLTQPHSTAMEVIHGRPYVMVTINAKGPFRFMVDTGTGADAIISPELASELGLPSAGERQLNDPTGNGQKAPLRRIDSLAVAGLDFYAIKAIEHKIPVSDGTCLGLLGFRLFSDFLLTLDYVHGRMILAEGELVPDGQKSVLPFSKPQGVPVARLTIGNRDVDAQIDSGGAGLSLPEGLLPQLRLLVGPESFGSGEALFSHYQFTVARLAADVRLGEITLDQPWVEIVPAFSVVNFGSCPLQHLIVTFDQENNLVRLDGPHKHITLELTPAPLPSHPSELALVPAG
jgi:hypothetical protein